LEAPPKLLRFEQKETLCIELPLDILESYKQPLPLQQPLTLSQHQELQARKAVTPDKILEEKVRVKREMQADTPENVGHWFPLCTPK
jgi:hypothetical protein